MDKTNWLQRVLAWGLGLLIVATVIQTFRPSQALAHSEEKPQENKQSPTKSTQFDRHENTKENTPNATTNEVYLCFHCGKTRLTSGELSKAKLYTNWIGFGAGYSVLGKYNSKGWIFTATEAVGMTLLLSGSIALAADPQGSLVGGAVTAFLGLALYVGFRIWEVIDFGNQIGKYSASSNRRKQNKSQIAFAVVPVITASGGGVGLYLRY